MLSIHNSFLFVISKTQTHSWPAEGKLTGSCHLSRSTVASSSGARNESGGFGTTMFFLPRYRKA